MTNWETCVQFHGHACGGLTIGYKAACYAAELLELSRSHGPEEAEEPTEPTRRIDFDHLQFGKDYEIK